MSSDKQIVQAPLARLPETAGCSHFLVEIKAQIRQRQYQAVRAA